MTSNRKKINPSTNSNRYRFSYIDNTVQQQKIYTSLDLV